MFSDIDLSNGKSILGDIYRIDHRFGKGFSQCNGDASAAGTQIGDPGHSFSSQPRLHTGFDQFGDR